jgi:hypothetical protein
MHTDTEISVKPPLWILNPCVPQGTTHGRQRGTWNMQAAGSCRRVLSTMDGWMEQDSRVAGCPAARRPRMNRPIGHAPQATPHRSRPKLSSGRALAMPRRPRGSRQQRPASSSRQRPGGAARSAFPLYCRRTRHRGRPPRARTHARGLRATIHTLRSIHPLSSALWRVLRTAPPHARATAQRRTTQPHGRPRMSVRLVAGHV